MLMLRYVDFHSQLTTSNSKERCQKVVKVKKTLKDVSLRFLRWPEGLLHKGHLKGRFWWTFFIPFVCKCFESIEKQEEIIYVSIESPNKRNVPTPCINLNNDNNTSKIHLLVQCKSSSFSSASTTVGSQKGAVRTPQQVPGGTWIAASCSSESRVWSWVGRGNP